MLHGRGVGRSTVSIRQDSTHIHVAWSGRGVGPLPIDRLRVLYCVQGERGRKLVMSHDETGQLGGSFWFAFAFFLFFYMSQSYDILVFYNASISQSQ